MEIDEVNPTKQSRDHVPTFPEKLMIILRDKKNEKAIRWNHNGTRFSIRNRHLLCNEVLPRYFQSMKTFKYGSFARKLSRWHFTRTSSGLDTRIYSNRLFLRDKPEFCNKMTCKNKIEKKKSKTRLSFAPVDPSSKVKFTASSSEPRYESKNSLSSPQNRCEANKTGKSSVLQKLRHDASILYDYPVETSRFQVHSDMSLPQTASFATTQAVVDAAIIAMNRCDEAVTKTAKAKDLNIKVALLMYERKLRVALEAELALDVPQASLQTPLYGERSNTSSRPELTLSSSESEGRISNKVNNISPHVTNYFASKRTNEFGNESLRISLSNRKRAALFGGVGSLCSIR